MFLKSLVLRGFKSFPDKTTLDYEPGITVVVGPNGSGKSNLVDAVSWVLGEQGPKSLRGGKMEDVIFAGSRQRPALGMAEVSLTIDNSSGVLPIDFTEVTITRTLFRSGESEYRLNGQPCRLLDIQEVLSDTGIGREQHTIIGQGQLDEILQADPAQLRGFVEEAAGVTKHRRRRQRAVARIASTEENLSRLSDLLSEIRRQLKPLRAQADVARRHTELDEDLRRVTSVQGARELASLQQRVGSEGQGPERAVESKEAELDEIEGELSRLESRRADLYAGFEEHRETAWALARGAERLKGLRSLSQEREKTLQAALAGTTRASAEARLAALEQDRIAARRAADEAKVAVADSDAGRKAVEKEAAVLAAEVTRVEKQLTAARSAARDAVARLVSARGELGALESSFDSAESQIARLDGRRAALETESDKTRQRLEAARGRMRALEDHESTAASVVEDLESSLKKLRESKSRAEIELVDAIRRTAALEAVSSRLGARELARRIDAAGLTGVVGILSELIDAPEELRPALEAVTGDPQACVVLRDAAAVEDVLAMIPEEESLAMLVPSSEEEPPIGESLASFLVTDDPAARSSLQRVVIVENPQRAIELAARHPGNLYVTRDGVIAEGPLVARMSAETVRSADEARERRDAARTKVDDIDRQITIAESKLQAARQRLDAAEAEIVAASDEVTAADRDAHALERELVAVSTSEEQGRAAAGLIRDRLEGLRASLPRMEQEMDALETEAGRIQEHHGRKAAEQEAGQRRYEEARLASARTAERARVLQERVDALDGQVESVKRMVSGVEERRGVLESAIETVVEIGRKAGDLADAASSWADEAEGFYQASRQDLTAVESEMAALRDRRASLVDSLHDLRERARRTERERSEFLFRARVLEERLREDLGMEPEMAITRYGHVWEVEDPGQLTEPIEKLAILDDHSLARRRARVERDLEAFGSVNPLAAQEFDALASRESFLVEQMADVRRSRRDLLKLVSSIDEKIQDLFLAAYEDVAREYERLFSMLFPGGQGRLRMTDPSDPLTSGVEVEARPGGKNLKRLSLLSGGERALSTLAFLFAIFRARPSPFYILDEVEAALDDVNLNRFLQLILEFRRSSQLLVVTHQKRTMEIGDILYGVSIRPDGASHVISERMPARSAEPDSKTEHHSLN